MKSNDLLLIGALAAGAYFLTTSKKSAASFVGGDTAILTPSDVPTATPEQALVIAGATPEMIKDIAQNPTQYLQAASSLQSKALQKGSELQAGEILTTLRSYDLDYTEQKAAIISASPQALASEKILQAAIKNPSSIKVTTVQSAAPYGRAPDGTAYSASSVKKLQAAKKK